MSIYEKLDIPKYIYDEWKANIENLLRINANFLFKEYLTHDFNNYSIEKFFIEYSILKDLECNYKDVPLYQTWMSALNKAIASKKLEGLTFD